MNTETLLPLLPALPLVMAAAIGLAGNRAAAVAGWVATLAVLLDLLTLYCICLAPQDGTLIARLWPLWRSAALDVSLGLHLDASSAFLLFVVLGVGGLIHLYAVGYMAHDPSRRRFFAFLNLFIGCMVVLVMAENLVTLFLGWEGVGLCSYLLIGFWYEREAPRRAAIKAFLVNRVGDVFFLAGLLILTGLTGTGSIAEIAGKLATSPDLVARHVAPLGFPLPLIEVVGICLALGACAKSAQFPLHTWLPDAMEGPTPVSALIHAATMVTSGVYLAIRMQPVFAVAPLARELLLALAVLTALGGAVAALTQYDLKRLLAWSTISQVGFMMAAAASGHAEHGNLAALAHLAAHAIFKALLFLAAGAIAHSLHGVLDIRRLAGFHRRMPWTAAALVVGALGLAGIAPFAGFFSKDAVLSVVAVHHPIDAVVLYLASLVTALYSARLVTVMMLVPGGNHDTARDPDAVMLAPMGLLAIGTLGAGILVAHDALHLNLIFFASLLGPILAAGAGAWWYRRHPLTDSRGAAFCRGGYGIDALYDRWFVEPARQLSLWIRDVLDRDGVDGLFEKLADWVATAGDSMKVAQTGRLGDYLVYIVLALVLMFWAVLP